MATITGAEIDRHVREVTDEEVSFFRENGWVYLPGLISRQIAGDLLAHLKRLYGVEYDELPRDHPDAQQTMERIKAAGPSMFFMSRLQDDHIKEIVSSRALGTASAKLTG